MDFVIKKPNHVLEKQKAMQVSQVAQLRGFCRIGFSDWSGLDWMDGVGGVGGVCWAGRGRLSVCRLAMGWEGRIGNGMKWNGSRVEDRRHGRNGSGERRETRRGRMPLVGSSCARHCLCRGESESTRG